jgi:Tfp pilus assembly protein PilF
MKIKQIIITGVLLVSVVSFAQKEELKVLKKIYAKDVIGATELVDYKTNLTKLESLATEESDKVYATFYKSMLPLLEVGALGQNPNPIQIIKFLNAKTIADLATGLNATLAFEKKSGKKTYTDDINETITSFSPMLINTAIGYGETRKGLDEKMQQENYKTAASILYSVYQLNPTDQEKLYYASNYAINSQDLDLSLKYLLELKKLNFSGEGTAYYAKNLASGKEDFFSTKADRDNLVQLKSHSNPREEKIESKRPEIVKNIANIYILQGKDDEAKSAIADARKENPNDVNLIISEADIYYKLKDLVKYKQLMNEALAKNPNNADVNYNLGVASFKTDQFSEAEKYYLKTIEIDPNYINAYLNLSDLKLQPDAKYVEEINKLGDSDKDMKRYAFLKAERQKLFNASLPILEKAYELDNTNERVKSNLLTVYNFLELTDKYKALKAKM